jgi:hypothetical protein
MNFIFLKIKEDVFLEKGVGSTKLKQRYKDVFFNFIVMIRRIP